jgi:hypothetical protein
MNDEYRPCDVCHQPVGSNPLRNVLGGAITCSTECAGEAFAKELKSRPNQTTADLIRERDALRVENASLRCTIGLLNDERKNLLQLTARMIADLAKMLTPG